MVHDEHPATTRRWRSPWSRLAEHPETPTYVVVDPTSPTGPTGRGPTFTVSGVVFERTPTGTEPVEGVCGRRNSHRGAMTDKIGFYSIAGVVSGSISVSASGSSYYVATITFPLCGDVNKDIEIVEVTE